MNICEYQAKDILRQYRVPVPAGRAAFDGQRAAAAARTLGGDFVMKVQVPAGARGRAGGVVFGSSPQEAAAFAERMIGSSFHTEQTGAEGSRVRAVLVEEAVTALAEFYLSLAIDTRTGAHLLLTASCSGGADIERTARERPERIVQIRIDPLIGLRPYAPRRLVRALGLPAGAADSFGRILSSLYSIFTENDCTLLELNPLALTAGNGLVALDAKISFDGAALFRHPGIPGLRDSREPSRESFAVTRGLNYVAMGGDIGCIVNGAGLAMATADLIQHYGGRAANFLDIGGGAGREQIAEGAALVLMDRGIRGLLVNIFGGITRCDVLAQGLVDAARRTAARVPVVLRLSGTNEEAGRAIIERSGLAVHWAAGFDDAVRLVTGLAGTQ